MDIHGTSNMCMDIQGSRIGVKKPVNMLHTQIVTSPDIHSPWALAVQAHVRWALVSRPGPLWAVPLWAALCSYGLGPNGPPGIHTNIYIYIYVHIYIYQDQARASRAHWLMELDYGYILQYIYIYITADILRQIYYGTYITADILRRIHYSRYSSPAKGRYIMVGILRTTKTATAHQISSGLDCCV